MKINTIYKILNNEYGSNFGEERISFPETELSKVIHLIPEGTILLEQCVRLLETGKNQPRVALEECPPEDWGYSNDLWNQEQSTETESFEEALELYMD